MWQESKRRGSWSRPASAASYQTASIGRHGYSSAQSSPQQTQRTFPTGVSTYITRLVIKITFAVSPSQLTRAEDLCIHAVVSAYLPELCAPVENPPLQSALHGDWM